MSHKFVAHSRHVFANGRSLELVVVYASHRYVHIRGVDGWIMGGMSSVALHPQARGCSNGDLIEQCTHFTTMHTRPCYALQPSRRLLGRWQARIIRECEVEQVAISSAV